MKKNIIFDFDGTLIDTNKMIVEGLDIFAIAYRGSALTHEEHQLLTGKPLIEQMAYINETKWEEMMDAFRLWYLKAHAKMAKPFEGITELLHYLKESQYTLSIVSNNSRETILFGLKQLEIETYFAEVITCDDVVVKKPSPEGLNLLIKRLNVTPDTCIFIGDSGNDILAGKNAGIASVLVGWTAVERQELLKLEPDFVIEHPLEILEIIGLVEEISA